MTKQPGRMLYLYLALACFLGIVLIFLFDGYLGVYDSVKADNGSYLQEVPVEQWQNPDRFGPSFSMGLDQTGYLNFTYKIENRRFTSYTENVVVTATDTGGETTVLVSGDVTAGAFGSAEVSWTMRGQDYVPASAPQNTAYNVHLTITRGSVTRELSIFINRSPIVQKVIPAPTG